MTGAVVTVLLVLVAAAARPARAQLEKKTVEFTEPTRPFAVDAAKIGAVDFAGKTILVPAITWGGDSSLLAANRGADPNPASLYAKQGGFQVKIELQDDFTKQLEAYVAGRSPCLRGTLDMIALASQALSKEKRLVPIVPVLLSWSAGGDGIVFRRNIKAAADLRGATVVVQQYSPSLRLLYRVLQDAGLALKDVTIKYTRDIIAVGDEDPARIFDAPNAFRRDPSLDAVVTIAPETMTLTSGGKVGTGAENSVKGARLLVSTKTINRLIADVVAFRSDFALANPDVVRAFAAATVTGMEEVLSEHRAYREGKGTDRFQEITRQMAQLFFKTDVNKDAIGMLSDVAIAGLAENRRFFGDASYSSNFERTFDTSAAVVLADGYLTEVQLASRFKGQIDLGAVAAHIKGPVAETKRFTLEAATARKAAGAEGATVLFSHTFPFGLNETAFDKAKYGQVFEKIQELATVYGGAVIEIVGHSDPHRVRKLEDESMSPPVVQQAIQSARILSKRRANAVKAALVGGGYQVVDEQLVTTGAGIDRPLHPRPKSRAEQQENMRVEVRVVNVEGEAWIKE
jgi:outer membrane protein OmpA-like peptidoglycan-associated protein